MVSIVPESPQAMMERRLLVICSNLYGVFGDDANHPRGLRARASIWIITHPHGGREPSCQALQEVLDAIHERARIGSNEIILWDGEREIHPRDHDYPACKALSLEIQDELILQAIRQNLINNQ